MQKQQSLEELKRIIARYDHYFESINTKSNLYLSLNMAITALLIAYLHDSQYILPEKWYQILLGVLAFVFNMISLIICMVVMTPYLRSGIKKSLIFFIDVSKKNPEFLHQSWARITEEELHDDYITQYNALAIGLRKKYTLLAISTWAIVIQTITILIYIITLIKK